MYIPPPVWARCHEPNLPPFVPEDRSPIVLGVDGPVTGDMFAVVAVTRHHERSDEVVIRATRMWDPREHGGEVPFNEIERWLMYVGGGCANGHPRAFPDPLCDFCIARAFTPGYNVICLVYDQHQVADMMQRIRRRGIVWVEEFDQGERRLVADAMLYRMALSGNLWHNGDPKLAEHVNNARA